MDEFQIIEQLRKRFFLIRIQGNQSYFIDIKTGASDLGAGHIMGFLVHEGHEYEIVKQVTNNLKDKLHPLCKEPVYLPHNPPTVRIEGLLFRNLWTKPEVIPSEADSQPFVNHLLLALGDENKVNYLLDLLAFRFQKPNEKKPHAVVYLYQAEGGNGKSLFATTLKHVYGESAVQITSEAKMDSGSRVQLWTRTLLIAEEASVKRASPIYDIIKTYSGTDELDDDVKHSHFKKHKIPATLLMISNNAPNFLEPQDRRFFVSEWKIDLDKESKAAYFTNYVNWLEKEGGYGAIAGLLRRRGVKRDMYAPVPLTEEKERAMSVGQDGCVRAIKDMMEDEPKARVFQVDNLSKIFQTYDVRGSQRKHKMTEAGLKEHGTRLTIGRERFRPWHRTTDKIVAIKNQGSFVEVDGKSIPLEQAQLKTKRYSLEANL